MQPISEAKCCGFQVTGTRTQSPVETTGGRVRLPRVPWPAFNPVIRCTVSQACPPFVCLVAPAQSEMKTTTRPLCSIAYLIHTLPARLQMARFKRWPNRSVRQTTAIADLSFFPRTSLWMQPPPCGYSFSPFTRVLLKSIRPQSSQPAASLQLSMNAMIKCIVRTLDQLSYLLYCFVNALGCGLWTVLWLCPSLPTETLKWLSSLPVLMH